jgi:hypothetical protein
MLLSKQESRCQSNIVKIKRVMHAIIVRKGKISEALSVATSCHSHTTLSVCHARQATGTLPMRHRGHVRGISAACPRHFIRCLELLQTSAVKSSKTDQHVYGCNVREHIEDIFCPLAGMPADKNVCGDVRGTLHLKQHCHAYI